MGGRRPVGSLALCLFPGGSSTDPFPRPLRTPCPRGPASHFSSGETCARGWVASPGMVVGGWIPVSGPWHLHRLLSRAGKGSSADVGAPPRPQLPAPPSRLRVHLTADSGDKTARLPGGHTPRQPQASVPVKRAVKRVWFLPVSVSSISTPLDGKGFPGKR